MDKKLIAAICICMLSNGSFARDITEFNNKDTDTQDVSTADIKTRLKSIYIKGKTRRALIDGMWINEGQTIGNLTVKKIQKDKVLISEDNQIIELTL